MVPHGHECWYVSPVMLNCCCLTSYIPKTENGQVSNNMDSLPASLPLSSMLPKDAEMHILVELAQAFLNPTPISSLIILVKNRKAAFKHLAGILNMVIPAQLTQTATKYLPQREVPMPTPRFDTSNETPEAALAPPPTLDSPGHIKITPGQSAMPTHQRESYVMPYDTKTMPP